MNSKTVIALIDKLANKELSFGSLCQNNYAPSHEPYTFIRKSGKYTIFYSKQFKRDMQFQTKRRASEDKDPYEVLGHPVLIGTVLAKFLKIAKNDSQLAHWNRMILFLWGICGIEKSLQEIAGCGYEEYQPTNATIPVEQLSDPNARALFEFLGDII